MPKLYDLSDKTIAFLNKRSIRRFQMAKAKSLMRFDELNVIGTVNALYAGLLDDSKKAFLELAIAVYNRADAHGNTPPTQAWINQLLDDYDDVLLYIFTSEAIRKKDRAAESIIAAKDKRHEFDVALNYWVRQVAQMADNITEAAYMKAYKDAGVKRVMYHTQEDERVCSVCSPLDGKIYPIDKAPRKQHYHCRCWYSPVIDK